MNNLHNDIITKRLQTTMIGAIYQFEENFGYLWGLDKDENELTEQEHRFRLKWEDTRNQILNNGNNQLRKCINELDKIQQNQPQYKYNFKYRR